mmetsp:Transcript_78473/g.141579  ORF Transcript_78473/g.141579 Transcript_78473/m.141579 type:complete len:183 (+) Transcript_78473:1-549(+)
MSVLASSLGWDVVNNVSLANLQLCYGLGSVFIVNLLDLLVVGRAQKAARKVLAAARDGALLGLREAIRAMDIKTLEHAVTVARNMGLQHSKEGEAAMGMANEVIGEFRAMGRDALKRGADALDPAALQRRVRELEAEVQKLRSENEALLCEMFKASKVCDTASVGKADVLPSPMSKSELLAL